jgi:hypothetical protein
MSGRKLESLKLYQDGIGELLKECKAEEDPAKKKYFHKKLEEYMDAAEKLKLSVKMWGSKGEIRDRIHITEGATNFGYDTIFGKYLDDEVREILIEEPYIKDHYQLLNLVMLCELIVSKCRNIKCMRVTTNKDTSPNSEQVKGLNSISESLLKHNVCLYVDYVTNLHDRQVRKMNFKYLNRFYICLVFSTN